MMASAGEPHMRKRKHKLETGPYVLRDLITNLPLSAEGDSHDIQINCVEFLDQNLYVGTSAAEILHFVQIPPDPADVDGSPTYILASRLPPDFHPTTATSRPGVQQILLLPSVNKACILCNWTVTFYSLPELSPVFGTTQVRSCNWIGGTDLNNPQIRGNLNVQQTKEKLGVTILISLGKRIRVVKIGEDARSLKTIDFAGSTISVRRDDFACVADARSYALLDVERQLKIPLFPISSLDDSQSGSIGGRVQDISGNSTQALSRSTSSATPSGQVPGNDHSHGKSSSIASFMGRSHGQAGGNGGDTGDQLFREASPAPETSPSRPPYPTRTSSRVATSADEQQLPPPPPPPPEGTIVGEEAAPSRMEPVYLKPHIASPSPEEFLLVTGTMPSEPGVGMFVNLEGDVTRSTLEFARYPSEIVVSGRGIDNEPASGNPDDDEEGYVIAAIVDDTSDLPHHGLEIQRWDLEPGDREMYKYWLEVPQSDLGKKSKLQYAAPKLGIRNVIHTGDVHFTELIDSLRLRRFHRLISSTEDNQATGTMSEEREAAREQEELLFARRLGQVRSKIAVWSGDRIWWAVRNPLALQLDARLLSTDSFAVDDSPLGSLDRRNIIEVINSVRGREPRNETEFLSLGYIRQHGGFLLLISLLESGMTKNTVREQRIAEDALVEGGLDPRMIMNLVPELTQEVIEGPAGIWIYGGIVETAEAYIRKISETTSDETQRSTQETLFFLKRFFGAWRKKKGFGSIPNESEVFRSVDAALLVVLLELDKASPKGPARPESIRAELNDLVDHGLECFDRAVSLLESHHRLYVLSRLYQSRKLSREVLSVWRRIEEGEADDGGELRGGEQEVRKYLAKVGNPSVVLEYGVWLAARHPKLGVQVFADDRSRVKFEPSRVVEILRKGAPNAVKDYLEYLVFGKNHSEYVNELIAYYLDIVIEKLEESKSARETLAQTYESYRALRPPKPTYRQFITDNAIEEEWWYSRLRLLQLLGGSHGSASQYDVVAILKRIKPYTQELVPEVIILDGRQLHHEQALKLLTHGLGDYDTAINYCLLGGSSIYHPISGTMALEKIPSREEQAMLFRFLLAEFLLIEDISNRVEQTGSLLERFGSWFDVDYVLRLIPDEWSVELVSGFLIHALRRIVRERSETMVVKALSGAENLKVNEALIDKIEEIGPTVEAVD